MSNELEAQTVLVHASHWESLNFHGNSCLLRRGGGKGVNNKERRRNAAVLLLRACFPRETKQGWLEPHAFLIARKGYHAYKIIYIRRYTGVVKVLVNVVPTNMTLLYY